MKTLGRILIVLIAFVLVMGITYVVVNAGGASTTGAPRFENGERPLPGDVQFQPVQRPPGDDFEGRREGGERGFGEAGMMFGFIKNTAIIAVIVALIAVPKYWLKNRKQVTPVAAE